MVCVLLGTVGIGLLVVTLRPLAPIASRVFDLIASQFDPTPEPVLVPIRVDRHPRR